MIVISINSDVYLLSESESWNIYPAIKSVDNIWCVKFQKCGTNNVLVSADSFSKDVAIQIVTLIIRELARNNNRINIVIVNSSTITTIK